MRVSRISFMSIKSPNINRNLVEKDIAQSLKIHSLDQLSIQATMLFRWRCRRCGETRYVLCCTADSLPSSFFDIRSISALRAWRLISTIECYSVGKSSPTVTQYFFLFSHFLSSSSASQTRYLCWFQFIYEHLLNARVENERIWLISSSLFS